MESGIQILNGPNDRLCLIEEAHSLTMGDLRLQSNEILATLDANKWHRMALINASVSTEIAAIHACQTRGTDLLLLRSEADYSDAIADQLELNAVLDRSGTPLQTFPNASPQGAGRLLLTTSGTSGTPKTAAHTLNDLCRTIAEYSNPVPSESWLLTYHPASFAGLQVILTTLLHQSSLIVPAAYSQVSLNDTFIKHRPTHISGTPSFWQGLLIGLPESALHNSVRQLTLGGEIADQATIDLLSKRFPDARIVHIYATTEAGIAFSVHDKQAGFPADWLSTGIHDTRLRIHNGQLEVAHCPPENSDARLETLAWIPTGDTVKQTAERVFFQGRTDGAINVGGSKVAPEEVEAVFLQHPDVAEIHVFGKPSPILGAIVAAEIVIHPSARRNVTDLKESLHQFAGEQLAGHKIPRMITFVESISMGATGKKQRQS